MKIYVVIVIYNGMKWIDKCLSSVLRGVGNIHLIVIDNGSTDGSREKIVSGYPGVRFITTDTNLGFGGANNLGMSIAIEEKADYVFLLNQDAWVEPDTIEGLVEIAAGDSRYGVISPVHLNGSYTGLDLNFSNYVIPEKCPEFYSDLYMGKRKEIYEVDFVNAAAWLIPVRCLKTVGLFEPMFFLYGEDNNYLQRVRAHQFKIGVTPAYTICHDREIRKGKLNHASLKRMKRTHSLMVLLDATGKFPRLVFTFFKNTTVSLLRSIYNRDIRSVLYDMNEIAFLVKNAFRIIKTRRRYHEVYIKE